MFSPLRAWLRGALLFVTGGAAGDDPRQAGAPADPAEAAQLEDFRQLTFGQPGGQLAKWQQPLRIALVEAPGAEAREIARRQFADLAALSGLAVEESGPRDRSEEHTSELQSLMRISYAVFCLKKKKKYQTVRLD